MLVMSDKGMQGILSSKVTLGAKHPPLPGRSAAMPLPQTDATMRADLLSWSRSRGVFGGLSLQGGTLRADSDVNQALYGQKETNKDILTGKVKPPDDAAAFLDPVSKYGGDTRTP